MAHISHLLLLHEQCPILFDFYSVLIFNRPNSILYLQSYTMAWSRRCQDVIWYGEVVRWSMKVRVGAIYVHPLPNIVLIVLVDHLVQCYIKSG